MMQLQQQLRAVEDDLEKITAQNLGNFFSFLFFFSFACVPVTTLKKGQKGVDMRAQKGHSSCIPIYEVVFCYSWSKVLSFHR